VSKSSGTMGDATIDIGSSIMDFPFKEMNLTELVYISK